MDKASGYEPSNNSIRNTSNSIPLFWNNWCIKTARAKFDVRNVFHQKQFNIAVYPEKHQVPIADSEIYRIYKISHSKSVNPFNA